MNLPIITPEPGSGHEGDPGSGHEPIITPTGGGIFNPPVFGAGPAATGGEVLPFRIQRANAASGSLDTGSADAGSAGVSPASGIGDWLGQTGPFGLTYELWGLGIVVALIIFGGKK